MADQQEEKKLTEEEVKTIKEKMLKHWETEIPFLEKQKQAEVLHAEIEEARMRQVYAQMKIGEMVAPPPGEEVPERKLRKP